MPIREFACPKGHVTEKIILPGEKDFKTTTCPTCHGRARRVGSVCAVQFRGDGWTGYATGESREGLHNRLKNTYGAYEGDPFSAEPDAEDV